MRNATLASFLLIAAWALVPPEAVVGQDVELLGKMHGTRPPAEYFERRARDAGAFRFEVEGALRLRYMTEPRRGMEAPGPEAAAMAAAMLGPAEGGVTGDFPIPVVLGLFSDSPGAAPFEVDDVQREFFDGPSSRHQTLSEYFHEASGGRLELSGHVEGWIRSSLTREQVAGGTSGLGHPARVAEYVEELLARLDSTGVDWNRFDRTGDGFVDVLAVMHPTRGGECAAGDRENRIWSHRWNLRSATEGRLDPGFRTSSVGPNGEPVYVNDYIVQPVVSCDGESVNQIGIFAHELGHAMGLPDLYSTSGSSHGGAGNWDLMGTGAWGCRGSDPSRPCHPGAWSKAVLGWVAEDDLEPGQDHGVLSLGPVQEEGRVLRVDAADDSGDYFLLENRQALGSDRDLPRSGLLVWRVDPEVLDARWGTNRVNADPSRMGVELVQADGSGSLARPGGGRGGPGDPFPGASGSTAFHAGSQPAALTHRGRSSGLTLKEISEEGQAIRFRALTRFQEIRVRLEGPEPEAGWFRVDGEATAREAFELRLAPFETRTIEAPEGRTVAEGVRLGVRWEDGSPRRRTFTAGLADSVLTASYDAEEVRVSARASSPVPGVEAGAVVLDPDSGEGWVERGTRITAVATAEAGFRFRGWDGAEGDSNPLELVAEGPLELGAEFELAYRFEPLPDTVVMEGAREQELRLEVEEATPPLAWTVSHGALPEGLVLVEDEGRLRGAPLEVGSFPLTVSVRDARGLEAEATFWIEVERPGIEIDRLVGPFLGTGAGPTDAERAFLDASGNRSGTYDVGDLRAHLESTSGAAGASATAANAPSPIEAAGRWVGGAPGGASPTVDRAGGPADSEGARPAARTRVFSVGALGREGSEGKTEGRR